MQVSYAFDAFCLSFLPTVCLVCNVQLNEVIIVFPSNKWVAPTRAGGCAVCMWSTIQHQLSCISQGSAATLFRWVGQFAIFLCEISSGFCRPKIIKIDSFFAESFKI